MRCPAPAVLALALACFLPLCRGAEPLLRCDVLIAGGSTAALSAALTSAAAQPTLTTCLTEPTDELGGQMAFNRVLACSRTGA